MRYIHRQKQGDAQMQMRSRGELFLSLSAATSTGKGFLFLTEKWFNQECTFFSFDEIFKITKLDLLFSPFTEGLFYVNVGT